MPSELNELARTFRFSADVEFRDECPVQHTVADALATDPSGAEPLLSAPPTQRRALLLFAAVQFVLRTMARTHPLAHYYPTLGGDRAPDAGLPAAFRALAAEFRGDLARLCATRTTQTNEARRAAVLRPAFALAAAGRPVALVELGTSAGLLLLTDRYRYRYAGGGRQATSGRRDAPEALVLDCEVTGDGWPDPAGAELTIADRVGLDLDPVQPDDPDATDWLRSCIWPSQTDRLARLDAALAEAATIRPRLVRGDLVDNLTPVLSTVDERLLPVVFASNAITYLPADARIRLVDLLMAMGRRRELAVILNESTTAGVHLFDREAPRTTRPNAGTLAYAHWRAGTPSVWALGDTGPHGRWLTWAPTPCRWRP